MEVKLGSQTGRNKMLFHTGDQYHGFTVTRVRELSEIHATLIEMTHTQSGRFVQREDDQ